VGGNQSQSGNGQGGSGTADGSGNSNVGRGASEETSIFDPTAIDEGDELDLDPNATDGDDETVGRTDGQTSRGEAYVPLSRALPRFVEQATRALDRAQVPPSLRAFVRAYFDRLGEAS
jgi:hypothetical protein